MNEAAAKSVRRDIRRAMGPIAIATLDQHADAIAVLSSELHDVIVRGRLTDHRIGDLEEHAAEQLPLNQDVIQHLAQYPTTFWLRLRWLVLGR
jgi:hypothetical protein